MTPRGPFQPPNQSGAPGGVVCKNVGGASLLLPSHLTIISVVLAGGVYKKIGYYDSTKDNLSWYNNDKWIGEQRRTWGGGLGGGVSLPWGRVGKTLPTSSIPPKLSHGLCRRCPSSRLHQGHHHLPIPVPEALHLRLGVGLVGHPLGHHLFGLQHLQRPRPVSAPPRFPVFWGK